MELQVYNFESSDVFGIYDNLDIIGLTDTISEQEKLSGTEYSKLTIKIIANNDAIDLLLNSREELAGRGNLG